MGGVTHRHRCYVVRADREKIVDPISVAYGQKAIEDLTESVSWVDEDMLRNQTAESLESMIQGVATGAHVTQRSGFPGSGAEARTVFQAWSLKSGHRLLPCFDADSFRLQLRYTGD